MSLVLKINNTDFITLYLLTTDKLYKDLTKNTKKEKNDIIRNKKLNTKTQNIEFLIYESSNNKKYFIKNNKCSCKSFDIENYISKKKILSDKNEVCREIYDVRVVSRWCIHILYSKFNKL